jgi:hypothetical protein
MPSDPIKDAKTPEMHALQCADPLIYNQSTYFEPLIMA